MEKVGKVIYDVSTLTDYDIYLFKQGNNFRLHEKLGAHLRTVDGIEGTHFAVWAPNARSVSVVGDFNGWNAAFALSQSSATMARGYGKDL